jgi:predicted MFS family arabinose efflux permease
VTSLTAQIYFPAQQSLLLNKFLSRSSTALSCNNSALFAGIAIGSVIGGQAMQAGGFTAILLVCAAVALAGFAAAGWRSEAGSRPVCS